MNDVFYPVLEQLFAYTDDVATLENFINLAANNLGPNWRQDIYSYLEPYDEQTKQTAAEKLKQVENFEVAISVWEEAGKVIEDPNFKTFEEVSQKLEYYKYWLSFFGEDGEDLYEDLLSLYQSGDNVSGAPVGEAGEEAGEEGSVFYESDEEHFNYEGNNNSDSKFRINVFEHQPAPSGDFSNLEYGIDEEVLWYFNNYILLIDYYERTLSRIAARCIRLGGITIEEYPQYGYVLDLLDEICTTGDIILEHQELDNLIEARIKGGVRKLRKDVSDFKQELEKNATPDMIKEEENMQDIINKLGGLAGDQDKSENDVDALIAKLGAESGVSIGNDFEDDSAPPPPPPPSQIKGKKPFGAKMPLKQPLAKAPIKQPMAKQPMPAGKIPLKQPPPGVKLPAKQPLAKAPVKQPAAPTDNKPAAKPVAPPAKPAAN